MEVVQAQMKLGNFSSLDFILMGFYFVLLLGIGLWCAKQKAQGKDFFLGGASIPFVVVAVSIFATVVSPLSFLSVTGNSFGGSWLLYFSQLGIFIAIPLTMRFFLPLYARLKIETAYHFLEIRYNSVALRILGSLMFILFMLGRMAIIMYLPCLALAKLTNWSVEPMIIIMGTVALIYAALGGLKAVLWTDFIQGLVLFLGVVLTLVYLVFNLDHGIQDLSFALSEGGRLFSTQDVLINEQNFLSTSILVVLIGGGLTTFSTYISSQDIVQRFTTTHSIPKLYKMTLTHGVLMLICSSLLYLVGTALYVYYQQNSTELALLEAAKVKQDQVLAYFITTQAPSGLAGIILAALCAAAQSTLSTGINATAASYMLDIQLKLTPNLSDKRATLYARLFSIGIGLASIIFAIALAKMDLKSAYEFFKTFLGLALGALAGLFVLTLVIKKATALAAFSAFLCAMSTVMYLNYNVKSVSYWTYSLIAIVVCLVIGGLVTLVQQYCLRANKTLKLQVKNS